LRQRVELAVDIVLGKDERPDDEARRAETIDAIISSISLDDAGI
jgi:hypothetical protein